MVVPLDIANAFIERSFGNSPVDHMKVQKLAYYAYGWWLAFHDNPITTERPQVWRYGPVFKSIYSRLADYGSADITQSIAKPFSPIGYGVPQESPEEAVINWVWDRYGNFSAVELSRQTHLPGTPWDTMAKQYDYEVPLYLEMDDSVVKGYFRGLANSEGLVWQA